MSELPVFHGSFSIRRSFRAAPAQVFAAWSDVETKARWFMGPPDKWRLLRRELDFRVGGSEILEGAFVGGGVSTFKARYHAIEPERRLVYVYDMFVAGEHHSVALATLELAAAPGGGTQMTFTEHTAFLDGRDGTSAREHGTAAHFDRLAELVADPHDIVSARVLGAPAARIFEAFADPAQLRLWWGPQGFSSTVRQFELRPGGAWRMVLHGPDGADYENASEFVEVTRPHSVSWRHLDPIHSFTMSMKLVELERGTLVTWRMRFDSAEHAAQVRPIIVPANEENFDRLEAHLGAQGVSRS